MASFPVERSGRSVNDYHTTEALRRALRTVCEPASCSFVASVPPQPICKPQPPKFIEPGKFPAWPLPMASNLNQNLAWICEGYDKETSHPPMLEMELRRLAVLKSYRAIGSGRNESYERLLALLSRLFQVPMAHFSVMDLGRQFFLAKRGLGDAPDFPRKKSICAHAIISKLDMLIIPDLAEDPRFQEMDYVKDGLRFYASAPLVCPEGFRLGTVCILDNKPRPEGLTLEDKQNLREIADMVMDAMVEHREIKNHEYRNPSQVIACTSNDLLSPLTGVVNGLASIRDDEDLLNSLPRQQREVLKTALACSSVMGRICWKSLETFQKGKLLTIGEAMKHETAEERKVTLLNLKDLIKHLHVVMEHFPKQVALIISADDAVPPVIVADELKIFRSAVNYLTNACANTDSGSVHLKIYLHEEDDDSEPVVNKSESVVFSVEDTGPGISVENYQYLFKPVVEKVDPLQPSTGRTVLEPTQNNSSTEHKAGLGLYSVATQIGSIGGKYGFRPREFTENGLQNLGPDGKPMKGSVFWFSIPLVLPGSSESVLNSPTADNIPNYIDEGPSLTSEDFNFEESQDLSVARPGGRARRALLIEDSLVSRKDVTRNLEKLGFEVVQAVNGLEGLKQLQSTLFDLVLCDFLMPVLDGIDCVQQYRQFEIASRPWFDQLIIGISAHASDRDIERGLKVGMNDYRPKPITLEVLEELVESQEFEYVTTRLDSIMLEADSEKETDTPEEKAKKNKLHVCLLAEEKQTLSGLAEKVAAENDFKVVVVHDGEAALRLLKMRNWDVVLLDDELPGLTSGACINQFREWEKSNRINKQKNVMQIGSSYPPSLIGNSASIQLPPGFDGAIGKPLSAKIFQVLLKKVAQEDFCLSSDIIGR